MAVDAARVEAWAESMRIAGHTRVYRVARFLAHDTQLDDAGRARAFLELKRVEPLRTRMLTFARSLSGLGERFTYEDELLEARELVLDRLYDADGHLSYNAMRQLQREAEHVTELIRAERRRLVDVPRIDFRHYAAATEEDGRPLKDEWAIQTYETVCDMLNQLQAGAARQEDLTRAFDELRRTYRRDKLQPPAPRARTQWERSFQDEYNSRRNFQL